MSRTEELIPATQEYHELEVYVSEPRRYTIKLFDEFDILQLGFKLGRFVDDTLGKFTINLKNDLLKSRLKECVKIDRPRHDKPYTIYFPGRIANEEEGYPQFYIGSVPMAEFEISRKEDGCIELKLETLVSEPVYFINPYLLHDFLEGCIKR